MNVRSCVLITNVFFFFFFNFNYFQMRLALVQRALSPRWKISCGQTVSVV